MPPLGRNMRAYFHGQNDLFQYYNGKLYIDCVDQDDEGYETVNLYAFSPDDCTREKVCQLPYGLGSGSWYYAIHRGYLYMYTGYNGKIRLERVALNELSEKSLSPELLYESDSSFVFAPYYLGNHVMFTKWDGNSGQQINTLGRRESENAGSERVSSAGHEKGRQRVCQHCAGSLFYHRHE